MTIHWLLDQDVARELQELRRAGFVPTAEQRKEYEARIAFERDDETVSPDNLVVADGTAEIMVAGVLTERPDLFMSIFSSRRNTTYNAIRKAIALAEQDDTVKKVVFSVASPGGTVEGLFDTLDAIARMKKPVTVKAKQALSAAFAIAATAGSIEARGKDASFGSIGVAVTMFVFEDEVTITNSDSPAKRPDLSTEEGKAVIVKELDDINDLFTDAIAKGRTASGTSTSKNDVKADFGRGATLLAAEAKQRGMIDKIAASPRPRLRSVGSRAEGEGSPEASTETDNQKAAPTPVAAQESENNMDLHELKTKHPDLFAAVRKDGHQEGHAAGRTQGVEAGIKSERDRVCAHLVYGSNAGDSGIKIAHKAIQDGTEMTATLQAEYVTALTNRVDQTARGKDGKDAEDAANGADPKAGDKDLGDRVADAMGAPAVKPQAAAS